MSASSERAFSRVVYYETLIEEARSRGESTEKLEENLLSAIILAELNDL